MTGSYQPSHAAAGHAALDVQALSQPRVVGGGDDSRHASVKSFGKLSHGSGGTARDAGRCPRRAPGCLMPTSAVPTPGRRAHELQRPLRIGVETGQELGDDGGQVARELPWYMEADVIT